MTFHISLVGRSDLRARSITQLRRAMLDGRLRPGDRLPSSSREIQLIRSARTSLESDVRRRPSALAADVRFPW